jgi:adenylate kinase family enzyme
VKLTNNLMRLNHFGKSKYLSQHSLFPKNPKVILFGSPNNDLKYFAHRLAIDLNVPALSMKNIYSNLLAYEHSYSNETFYRKVISILKNTNKKEALSALESQQIPEKLINLTKYSDLGYVIYDYPLNLTQAQNLENISGGMNIVLNLMLKRDAALAREKSKYVCSNCNEVYFKEDINFSNQIILEKNFPENSVCSSVSTISIL